MLICEKCLQSATSGAGDLIFVSEFERIISHPPLPDIVMRGSNLREQFCNSVFIGKKQRHFCQSVALIIDEENCGIEECFIHERCFLVEITTLRKEFGKDLQHVL